MSARSAAVRFGIGISPAIAWISNARQGQLISGKQANVPVPDWMSMRHLSLAWSMLRKMNWLAWPLSG